jgi:hypothetical protein
MIIRFKDVFFREFYSETYDSSGNKVNKAFESFVKSDSLTFYYLGKITIDPIGKAHFLAGEERFTLEEGI